MKILKLFLVAVSLAVLVISCDDSTTNSAGDTDVIIEDEMVLNPSGFAPLSARLDIMTEQPVTLEVEVRGLDGDENSVSKRFENTGTEFQLPVLGLFPGVTNIVEVAFFSPNGQELGSKSYEVTTNLLIEQLPDVDIDQANSSQMKEGMTFASYFGHSSDDDFVPQRPFMFDVNGNIRWYLDLSDHPTLSNLFYDNGMERLQNGNLYFGDGSTDKIYEMDMLGNILNEWEMPGFGFHHNVIEKPDGNFLVTVNKLDASTIEDYIIEIDRSSGNIVNEWDLNESLDNERRAWETNLADLDVDWFHANALWYDESDNSIVVSGRTQGTVKLTENNKVVWILAPHKEWNTSGRGEDLSQFLLQPLDAAGNPIEDDAVLSGESNHQDFEWAWYQHAPQVLPNGNIMLFDNGDNRNYDFTGFNRAGAYSRAVEYEINESDMTIQQVWQFGQERGSAGFSRIVSDVDFDPATNHVFYSPGSILEGENFGKVIEINRSNGNIIYEATVRPPNTSFNVTFHRTERMPIYPE